MSNSTDAMLAALANYPAMPPPPGVQSNFDHPQTDGKVLIIVGILSTILPFIAVVLRLYARKYVSRQSIWWDDGLCLLAVLGSIVHTTLMIKNLDNGLGKHMWDIRALSLTHNRLVVLVVMNDVIAFTTYLVRCSILLLYYRLFNVSDLSRRLVWVGLALCTIITIPNLGVIITRDVKCSEPTSILTTTFCHTRTVSTNIITFDVFNVVLDFYILFIPLHQVRGLQMKATKKRRLIALFGVGFLACAMAVAQSLWVAIHFTDPDTLRYALWVGLFAILEVNIALLCSCAIFMPAIWKTRPSLSLSSLLQGKKGSSRYALGSGSRRLSGEQSNGSHKNEPHFSPDSMELEDGSTRRLAVHERSNV